MIGKGFSIKALLVVFFLFCGGMDGAETLTVEFEVKNTKKEYSPKYMLAAWIDKENGSYVDTMASWTGGDRGDMNWHPENNNGHNDARMGATQRFGSSPNKRTVTWDMKDRNGNIMPDGIYKIFIENASAGTASGQAMVSFSFNKNGIPVTQTPTVNSIGFVSVKIIYNGRDVDVTPPSQPENIAVMAISGSEVEISWSPSTDNKSVKEYIVRRNGSIIKRTTALYVVDSGRNSGSNYSYTVEATDDAGNLSGQSATKSVQTLINGSYVNLKITNGADDAEELVADKSMSLTSPALELVVANGSQLVGLRFRQVQIPKNSIVSKAYLQFQSRTIVNGNGSMTIHGHAADHSAPFTTKSGDLSSRNKTTQTVGWTPSAWTSVGERGPKQRTSDISAILNSIFIRTGWVPGNALSLIISGTGKKVAESFDGLTSGAAVLHIEYTPGANEAPVVDAGVDQTITLPVKATLNGTVSDDNNPTGTLTSNWSKVSGPGTVSFSSKTSLKPQATFSVEGEYTLKLTATDGDLTTSDVMVVSVLPEPPVNTPPTVSAGSDISITLPVNVAQLNGGANDSDGDPLTVTWTKASGPGTVSFSSASSLSSSVTFSKDGAYVLRLTVNDGTVNRSDVINAIVKPEPVVVPTPNDPPTVKAGLDIVLTLPEQAQLLASASDDGEPGGILTKSWSKLSGPGTVMFSSKTNLKTSATFSVKGDYVLQLSVSDGDLTSTDSLKVKVLPEPPTNNAPVVVAGVDQETTLPTDVLNLKGSVSDSDGDPLTVLWEKINGPGSVTFSSATTVTGTVRISVAGDYTLRLTAHDGQTSSFDELNITVHSEPLNLPPIISAGKDQEITLPQKAQMNGTASDPENSTLTLNWSQLSGPGNVSFDDPTILNPWVQFSNSGSYTLELQASDGVQTSNDVVDIIVHQEIVINHPPVVQAGDNKEIFFPGSVSLKGTASDPDQDQLVTLWKKVDGDGVVTFTKPGSLMTEVDFSIPGVYTLALEATDGELTMQSQLTITVKVSLSNLSPVVKAGEDDFSKFFPVHVQLNGEILDDDFPGYPVTVVWEKISGPGDVLFTNPSSAETEVEFTAPGYEYILSLTASDGEFSVSDNIRFVDTEFDGDGDGASDMDEIEVWKSDPNDFDSDKDGMPDGFEAKSGLNPMDATDKEQDLDEDGLVNFMEFIRATDPDYFDTDDDGMPDGWEVENKTDPRVNDAELDNDGDGMTNYEEFLAKTDPSEHLSVEADAGASENAIEIIDQNPKEIIEESNIDAQTRNTLRSSDIPNYKASSGGCLIGGGR